MVSYQVVAELLLPFPAVYLLLDHATSYAVAAFAVKTKQIHLMPI